MAVKTVKKAADVRAEAKADENRTAQQAEEGTAPDVRESTDADGKSNTPAALPTGGAEWVARLELPMARMAAANGARPHIQRAIDLDLTGAQASALRDLYDGLCAKKAFGDKPNPRATDALRWLLDRVGEALADGNKKA